MDISGLVIPIDLDFKIHGGDCCLNNCQTSEWRSFKSVRYCQCWDNHNIRSVWNFRACLFHSYACIRKKLSESEYNKAQSDLLPPWSIPSQWTWRTSVLKKQPDNRITIKSTINWMFEDFVNLFQDQDYFRVSTRSVCFH